MDKLVSTLFPFVDFLYILQLEHYHMPSYLTWIQNRLFKRNFQKVGKIRWTSKAKIVFGLSLFLYFVLLYNSANLILSWWWLCLCIVIVTFLIPYIVLVANILFQPFDMYAKYTIVRQAARKLNRMPHCKIVAIAGSYGKTSTRLFAYHLLKNSRKTYTTGENHNILLSIAMDITSNVPLDTEVYLVEMGEFAPGDLQKITKFLYADICVITGISSQHIAHFRNGQEGLDQEFITFFNASFRERFLNIQDAGIKRLLPQFTRPYHEYSTADVLKLIDSEDIPAHLNISHTLQNVAGAVALAKHFDVPDSLIAAEILSLEAVDRRMDVMQSGEITIIDDSYNINPDSAAAALEFLNGFVGRKVVVTGGIVEQGKHEVEANIAYGNLLAQKADVIILARNILASLLNKGITDSKGDPKVHYSAHPDYTPSVLQDVLKPGDVVLIQNELPDTYWN